MPGLEGGTARIRTTPHTVATPSNTQIHQVSDTHLLNPAELASDLLCQAKADMTCVKKKEMIEVWAQTWISGNIVSLLKGKCSHPTTKGWGCWAEWESELGFVCHQSWHGSLLSKLGPSRKVSLASGLPGFPHIRRLMLPQHFSWLLWYLLLRGDNRKMFVWGYCKENFSQILFSNELKQMEPPGHFPCPYIAKVSLEGKKASRKIASLSRCLCLP